MCHLIHVIYFKCYFLFQSLQFSAVSEDSLNMAVQLAKRDLKKQKEESLKPQGTVLQCIIVIDFNSVFNLIYD